jgi:cytochrome P450
MPEYDPFSYAVQEDPYPIYRRLRDEAPAWWSERHRFWAISRYDDVLAALKDPTRFSNRHGIILEKGFENEAISIFSILAMDPPRHDRHRALVSRGFTPRRVAELEPYVRALADDCLDAVTARGRCDFVAEVAAKIPMDVISELLGVPRADRDRLRLISDTMLHREEGATEISAEGRKASIELRDYFASWVADAKRRGQQDLAGTILRATIDGEHLSEEEVIGFLFLLVIAGNETTRHLLGNALYWLWRHPEQRALVAADPSRIPAWIEETLRFDMVTQGVARTLGADVALHGETLREGDRATLLLGSANRDDRYFESPDEFDLARDGSGSLSFGTGTHFCLGASLARLEARLTLERVMRRMGDFELVASGLRRVRSSSVRGFSAMPLEFSPGG